MTSTTPFLSVIVPLYNEEKRVNNVEEITNYLSKKKFRWELVLVNDGSTDKTERYINKFKSQNIKIISYSINRGKGYAIRQGMLIATGKNRLFLDIDLSTPITEFDKFLPVLDKSDVHIGTRKNIGSSVVIHQPWLRENLGKGFTLLSQMLLKLPISDFTCGFKCFSGRSAEKVFRLSLVNRWGFDAEILFLCHKLAFSITEVPIIWKDDARTRVKFPQDIVRSFIELLTIRLNSVLGRYH